jgi:hypothetical protein
VSFKESATKKRMIFNINAPTYEAINPKKGKPRGFARPSKIKEVRMI